MTDLVLPRLYCHRPRRPAYLLSSLSSVDLVIPVRISFVVPIVSPICHKSAASVLTAPCFCRRIRCHPYPPSLSSRVSDSAVLFNLSLPCRPHTPLSLPSHISASAILIILHLFRISDVNVSIVPCLCRCCVSFLLPHSARPSRYY